MEVRLVPYLIFTGCSAAACILWFFLADRQRRPDGKSPSLSLLILLLGVLSGAACARLVWVLFRIMMRPPLFALPVEELSYYGGVAGVILAVAAAARVCGRGPRETLNTFAPAGAFLAAMFRFAEGFLGTLGFGTYLEEGIFFPVTVEIVWDEYFSEYYIAVFMLEGFLGLAAMVFALLRAKDRNRWIRTLFYLCLPQVLCESLRIQSIRWLFIRAEQLVCFLLCEGVLVWYALRRGPRGLRSWFPALTGLLVCGLVIAVEFALDGKITVGGQGLSPWLLYALMAAGLCALAAAEHRAHSEDNRTARDR